MCMKRIIQCPDIKINFSLFIKCLLFENNDSNDKILESKDT